MTFTIPRYVALSLISFFTILGAKLVIALILAAISGPREGGLFFVILAALAVSRLLLSAAAALVLGGISYFSKTRLWLLVTGSVLVAAAGTVLSLVQFGAH